MSKDKDPAKIGELDGWTITDHGGNVLTAEKDGRRPIRCAGGTDTPAGVLRQRVFEAIAESEAAPADGDGTAARGGAVAHPATIVTHDGKEG